MDLIDKLQDIANRISKTKNQVGTEEATKNAFVMPFLSALGYDVFDPREVVPEFTADLGTKKGEKVDYCIFSDEEPVIIVECKHWEHNLEAHESQLHRYFHATTARFGILTNGIVYKFYSDIEELNKMDNKPFFEFSFEKLNENIAIELKRFHKEQFNIEETVNIASDLKYSKHIKELLAIELKEPGEDFVKFFASRIYNGKVTKRVQEQFTILVQKSSKQLMSEMINERLKSALTTEQEETKKEIEAVDQKHIMDTADENGILTTEEEMEAFRIVQAILRRSIAIDRVFMRDTKSYCGIILDDNNRKPICRLYLNSNKKYIGVFDSEKYEERIEIQELEDIFQQEAQLIETAQRYD